ncbi:flavodoxin family protein [Seleniivibrio sp.]|uniref:flavodoxin family protein n=1 Tax=Seleniivibrio sp. TaxID=2898801 RepID=UPI0025EBF939|nr:flavodoxin family protein [Seleniivibrio sp.]MCD8554750.1 flavodoxin family protein [Seleniivibrio sp.]
MSKNVLVLSSSPRKNANSDILCDEFIKGASEIGHSIEKILLKDKKINYCTGCVACTTGKACPQKDDMAELIEKMVTADVIVLATPVYFYSMCAQLKTMIDRTCAGYQRIRNKEFYFIATAAVDRKNMLERTFEGLRGFIDCLDGSEEKGTVYGVSVWNTGEIRNTDAMKEAFELGKNI